MPVSLPGMEEVDGVEFRLGKWLNNRRREFGRGELSAERIADLDALGVEWDPLEAEYQRNLAALRQYVERGSCPGSCQAC